ncbi:diguanylate cyclase domain-containing protein [Pseudoalteromonas xiamenensis]
MNKSAQILVVDDNPLNRLVLENTLNDDYDIVVCGSCEEAQSVLSKKNVDLILLDILMGNGSGFELLEKCKTCIHSYNIPIIIVSQSHSFQDEAKALELGAVDYVTKPYSPAIIKARVKIHLTIKKKNDLLGRLANIDGLTEIPNRRALEENLSVLWQQAVQSQQALAFLLISIDYFKSYNDKHGYAQGDGCLVKVANQLEHTVNEFGGFVARFDGVRFAVVLTKQSEPQLMQCTSALHLVVEQLEIPHQASPISAFISLSIGGVLLKEHFGDKPSDVYELADSALLKAGQVQSKFELVVR